MRINEHYLALKTENKYSNLDEEKILIEILQITSGSLESAISRIINQTVLEHIHFNIDSTIMQMLTINDYLIQLFIKNFDILINNYIVHYLQLHHIDLISEQEEQKINQIVSTVDMKTDLGQLIKMINQKWDLLQIK